MREILSLCKSGYGDLPGLLALDSPEILDALEWEHMSRMVQGDAANGHQ